MNYLTSKDNTIEFFADDDGRLFFKKDQVIYPWSDLTVEIGNMLMKDMEHHGADAVLYKAGITGYVQQMEQYVRCRYSALNLIPDFINNRATDSEFCKCSVRNCRFGQKLCSVVAAYGNLTRREQEVTELVSEDLSDKMIAANLVISINTVHTHMRNILSKLGEGCTRVKIAMFYARHATI